MELRLPWIILIFAIFMMSGPPAAASPVKNMQASAVAEVTVPEYAFYLCIEITNRIYNSSLLNSESADYKNMYAQVSTMLREVFNCSTCGTHGSYKGIAVMSFSNGSVIANSTIVFQTAYINAILVKNLFLSKLQSTDEINGLKINRKYTKDVATPVPATLPTTTSTTTPLTRTTHTTKPANTKTTHDTTTHNTTTVTSKHPGNTPTTSASTSRSPAHQNSTTSAFNHTSRHLAGLNTTTAKPLFNTTTSHAANISVSNPSKPNNTSTSTTKTRKTEAIKIPTTSSPVSGGGVYYYEGVPGWAIALLVLACIILLLLIILLIITLIRWCCWDTEPEPEPPLPEQHTPYERKTFKEPLSTPSYSPQTPQKSPIPASPFEDPTKPRVNRTGMYVVNPDS